MNNSYFFDKISCCICCLLKQETLEVSLEKF